MSPAIDEIGMAIDDARRELTSSEEARLVFELRAMRLMFSKEWTKFRTLLFAKLKTPEAQALYTKIENELP